jgi:tetratricopeptide (TPR) repeat protein
MEKLISILINSNDLITSSTLDDLKTEDLFHLKNALILLWKVHNNKSINDKAFGCLKNVLSKEEVILTDQTFSVFKSIIEFLPWMGEYRSLQSSNFDKFRAGKEPFEHLLASSILVESYLDLGRKLYMLFDLADEAQVCFEGIIKYNNHNAEAFYALGRLAERFNQSERALEYFEKCISIDDNHTYGLLQLGILKASFLNDYKGAVLCFDKVIEKEPFMIETYVLIAEAHLNLSDINRAKQFIDIALGINEYHDESLNLLGRIYWLNENDVEKAIETFQKGLDHQLHGDSALLLASLGELYSENLGEYDKARAFYEKSLTAKQDQPETLSKLITILVNIYQDFGAVSICFENFLSVEKNNPSVFVDYAGFLIKYMHDYDFAAIQLNEALAIDPENEEALNVYSQIKDYIGDDGNEEDVNDDDDEFEGGGAADDN